MKKAIASLLLAFVMLGICGCAQKENRIDRMLNYATEKYGAEFTYVSAYGGYSGSQTHNIIATTEALPGKQICVSCTVAGGEETYSDNYLGMKYEQQTRDLLSQIMRDLTGSDALVIYTASTLAS